LRQAVLKFINNSKEYPLLAGFSSGFYALLYLYDKNFTLVDSWSQFLFFVLIFCLAPALLFYLMYRFFNSMSSVKKYAKYVIPVLNFMFFAFYIVLITQGLHKKKILFIAIFIAFMLGVFLFKHIKKVVVFQLLLSCFLIAKLIPSFYNALTYSYEWQSLPDDIKEAKFVKKPNIYYLQPDGYVDFSNMKKGYYQYNNDKFKSFLEQNDFKVYDNFRSNYTSTLTSNSSVFSMKHHYYGYDQNHDDFYKARSTIVGKNAVIDIFNQNNYKTNLILDVPYLVVNRPKMKYDYCNIDYSDIPYLTRGFGFETNTKEDLFEAIKQNDSTNNFYFVRQPKPGHISTTKSQSKGVEQERKKYFEDLQISNNWLEEVVVGIEKQDPEALIIVLSDHGGFVGFDYTRQSKTKTQDSNLVASMYSTVFAVKWPQNDIHNYDKNLKSSINLFRVVFSYLSENESYLNNLEPDNSFAIIKEGAPSGVYEIINDNGEVVFNKYTN
jgi:hypothetical protein